MQALKSTSFKELSLSNTNNFSKYPNPGIQYQDKEESQAVMIIFLYHITGLHFPKAIKQ